DMRGVDVNQIMTFTVGEFEIDHRGILLRSWVAVGAGTAQTHSPDAPHARVRALSPIRRPNASTLSQRSRAGPTGFPRRRVRPTALPAPIVASPGPSPC